MKYLFIFLLPFMTYSVSFGEEYVLEGYAPSFVGKKVTLYTYQDYFTMTKIKLGESTVSVSDSMFRIPLSTASTIKGIIEVDRTEAFFYIAPETAYQVYFPKVTNQPISFQNQKTDMIFFGLDSTDINYRILMYNQWFDMFVALHYETISSGNFATYLDTFKVDVQNAYSDVEDEYFITYVRYNIAELEQVFNSGKNGPGRLNTYLTYIEPFPIYYENDQYMRFINRFYTQDFEDYVPDIEVSINLALYNASPTHLMQALKKDLFLERPDIREMVMINKLGRTFYKRNDMKRNILIMLDSIENYAKYSVNATISKNIKAYLTNLEYGFPAPYISLTDSAGEVITWGRYEGKYVYLNFFATWNEQSVLEMHMINNFKKKYGEEIAFLSINVDEDKDSYEKYMNENAYYDWDIIYLGKDNELMDAFQAKTVPVYYLIDQAGFILYAPCAGPSPDGEYESVESTFIEIQNYLRSNK